jgi:predicted dehydrogenase
MTEKEGRQAGGITRRAFLAKSIGAGLVLGAPSLMGIPLKDPSDKVHVAILGFGKQGRVLFEAMANIPGLHFQAVCDIWEYNRKGGMGKVRALQGHLPNGYVDAAEMLEKEKGLDAVIVATPDFWHSRHTVMCLEAGLHVYCEKMMSHTIDGARAMVRAAEASGKLCQIGHQRRSNPRYRYTLNELIRKHEICGQIVDVNGQWNRAVSASQDIAYKESLAIDPKILNRYGYKNMHQFMNWRTYRDLSGGPISDLGAHQIDIFNWFLGTAPKKVYASGGSDYFTEREHFDNVMTIFDYDTPQGGCRAFYQVLTTTSAGGGYYESFMGTEGTINISERAAYTSIYRESGATKSWEPLVQRGYLKKVAQAAPASTGGADAIASYELAAPEAYALPGQLNKPPHQPHLENFFAAVRGKEPLNCDARHAFESEAPIYWVNPSALQGMPIELTEKHLNV